MNFISPGHLTLLPPPVNFFFVSELSQEVQSLFIHADLLLPFLDSLLIGTDHSWGWRRWYLRINQLSLTSLLSSDILNSIIPSRCLKRAKACSDEDHSCNPGFCFVPSSQVPKVTVAKVAPSLHIPNWPFLVCMHDMSKAPPVISFSIKCCQFTLEDTIMVQVPHEDQGQWLQGFFQLSEEDLMHFFLTRQSVGDTHNITHVCLPPNCYPQALSILITHPTAELHTSVQFSHILPNSPFLPSFLNPIYIHRNTPVVWTIPPCLCNPDEIRAMQLRAHL